MRLPWLLALARLLALLGGCPALTHKKAWLGLLGWQVAHWVGGSPASCLPLGTARHQRAKARSWLASELALGLALRARQGHCCQARGAKQVPCCLPWAINDMHFGNKPLWRQPAACSGRWSSAGGRGWLARSSSPQHITRKIQLPQ